MTDSYFYNLQDNSATPLSIKNFKVNKPLFDESIRNIEKNSADITSVLNEIDQLFLTRRCLIFDNNRHLDDVIGLKNLIGISEQQLYNEYCLHSFNSEIVKESVLAIRRIFLDDTKEIFHKFKCTKILYNIRDYISFRFSAIGPQYTEINETNNTKTFEICIAAKHEYSPKYTESEYIPSLYSIHCNISKNYSKTIYSTYDTEKLKTELYKFVNSNDAESYSDYNKEFDEEFDDSKITLDKILYEHNYNLFDN